MENPIKMDDLVYNGKPWKFNSEFTPAKLWLEDDPFLLGWSIFFRGRAVKLGGVMSGRLYFLSNPSGLLKQTGCPPLANGQTSSLL